MVKKITNDETTATRKKSGKIVVSNDYFGELASVKNTGNGYHAKFIGGISNNDTLLSLDYGDAHSLWLALCLEFGDVEVVE